MGCASSNTKNGGTAPNTKNTKKPFSRIKSDDINVSDDDITLANEVLRQKQERERLVFEELQAEKEALRAIASMMIEQRSSCESLSGLLEKAELEEIKQSSDAHRQQKQVAARVFKHHVNKKAKWVVYNNLDAISEPNIEMIAEFMNCAIIGACNSNVDLSSSSSSSLFPKLERPPVAMPVTPRNLKDLRQVSDRNVVHEYGASPESSPARPVSRKSVKISLASTPEEGSSLGGGAEWSSKEPQPSPATSSKSNLSLTLTIPSEKNLPKVQTSRFTSSSLPKRGMERSSDTKILSTEAAADLKKQLLSMHIVTVTPQSAFRITDKNVHDYDIPPGLVTIGVASTVIEVFKRGGRLSVKSIHKLLRLGFRSFKARPNTTQIKISGTERITVVGDIHGQISDLLHIIDSVGMPSSHNRYLFNGDFVDRGAYGVEVMCVLLALHAAMPEYVTLNRGNHEDYAICTAYGFQLECFEKYGELMFGMFIEVFQHIPLFAVINDAVFVLHGGLFHTRDTLLSELNAIKRSTFSLEDLPEGGEGADQVPRFKRKEFLKQLVRDALWSDPVDKQGAYPSVRGAGIGFGPDITRTFLNSNKLKFVVRSHECVRSGYNEPYTGENQGLLCTIFSASDYGSSGNSAAYMTFRLVDNNIQSPKASEDLSRPRRPSRWLEQSAAEAAAIEAAPMDEDEEEKTMEVKFVRNSNLCYTVHYYYIDAQYRDGPSIGDLHRNDVHVPSVHGNVRIYPRDAYNMQYGNQPGFGDDVDNGDYNVSCAAGEADNGEFSTILVGLSISLYELILDKKYALQEVFSSLDAKKEGVVSKSLFARVLHDILLVPLQWFRLLPVLLSPHHFRVHHGKRMIDYSAFLNQFLEPTTVPKNAAPVEDTSLDALGRYLKSMESSPSVIAVEQTKKESKENDVVKAPRSSSSSLLDVSHHKTNLTLFDVQQTQQSQAKLPKVVMEPLAAIPPMRTRASSDPDAKEAELALQAANAKSAKEKEQEEAVEEEDTSFHHYLIGEDMLETLYTNYSRLETAFNFFDRGSKGFLTREDLRVGYQQLKAILPEGYELPNLNDLMAVLDVHESGEVSVNLFFEMFRISDQTLKAHIDDDDEDDEAALLSRDPSSEHLGKHVRAMSVTSLSSSMLSSPHHATGNDSHSKLLVKGVSINVDEMTDSDIARPASGVSAEDVTLDI